MRNTIDIPIIMWWILLIDISPHFHIRTKLQAYWLDLYLTQWYKVLEAVSLKLFYKINPDKYREALDKIRNEFGMHEEVDEAKTMLTLNSEDKIELVSGMYDPIEDDVASIRVVLVDESLKDFFDSILGEPYRVR
ncbi:MAG: hypothetical protein ACXAEF_04995 [Candidatus Thorarchaeota archaeon]